ncbi:hypothetical protein [Nocardia takedensis]|uniref:hypothetical protein n=1 Tax=Nocardia takedensis TaxID=259390 RepID=UPI0012F6608C|nr:hypothetical protein [Nocardia takedensis]
MTTPQQEPESVPQWQTRLLLTIGHLAAERERIFEAGWEGFEDNDGRGPEAAWEQHMVALDGERERVEQTALTAGIDPGAVADAAALGRDRPRPRVDAPTRELSSPARDDAARGFYLDMLSVDLWRLERMAAVTAEREDRIATGRYSFGLDSPTGARFAANMTLFHQRAATLAAAAGISPAEAEELWGAGAETMRRQHARHLAGHTELDLIQEWQTYARPTGEPATPGYVPHDPATGIPTATATAAPPGPRQMIAAAQTSLRAHFLDTALGAAGTGGGTEITTAFGALSAAVDDALPVTGVAVDDLAPRVDPGIDGAPPGPYVGYDP